MVEAGVTVAEDLEAKRSLEGEHYSRSDWSDIVKVNVSLLRKLAQAMFILFWALSGTSIGLMLLFFDTAPIYPAGKHVLSVIYRSHVIYAISWQKALVSWVEASSYVVLMLSGVIFTLKPGYWWPPIQSDVFVAVTAGDLHE